MKKTQWIQDYTSIRPTEKNKEILLKEYETAVKQLESEEKVFTQAITIFSALITILISALLTNLPKLKEILNPLPNYYQFITVCFTLFFTYFITIFLLGYFAKKQNDITYSLRKIIIIREIMGCSYDLLQTVLPSWTVHGANNPFSIKKIQPYNSFIFWGIFLSTSFMYLLIYLYLLRNTEYLKITLILIAAFSLILICRNFIVNNMTYLFYVYSVLFIGLIITGTRYELYLLYDFSWQLYCASLGILFIIKISSNSTKIKFSTDIVITYIMSVIFLKLFHNHYYYIETNPDSFFIYMFGVNLLLCYSIFQKKLFDNYENFLLIIGIFLAKILNYKLHPNILFAIYKAKLSIAEVYRLEIDLNIIKNIAVQIEDKRFYSRNFGIDSLALIRAILLKCMNKSGLISLIITWSCKKLSFEIDGYTKNSGGSTIVQQLFRTLFINEPFYKKIFIRKLLEIYFSFWMLSVFSKEEILELYICSVRYENKIHGVANALEHFFSKNTGKLNILDKATSFILIERLSVIHSNLYPVKVNDWIILLKNRGILELQDIQEIYSKYEFLLKEKKVIFKEDKDKALFKKLKAKWFEK